MGNWTEDPMEIIHHCADCGKTSIINCTTGETTETTEGEPFDDELENFGDITSPQFIAFTTFKKLVSIGEVQLKNDYKWHLMDVDEMPGQEEELLGWEHFSQLRRRDIRPLSTKLDLDLRSCEYHFDEVCWGYISEDIHIPAVLLFDHTLDIPIMWAFVDLTATAGGNITIARTVVIVCGWE